MAITSSYDDASWPERRGTQKRLTGDLASLTRELFSLHDEAGPSNAGDRFAPENIRRDAIAGLITGLMAIPLSVGISIMSNYPIQVGLVTVIATCIISFFCSLFRTGNHVGVPGIAAGLAPMLALGVHNFGAHNMPWIVFMTATLQMVVWRYDLSKYLLKTVPPFLVEGLLAGVGLKIVMKFLPDTYTFAGVAWLDHAQIVLMACSAAAMVLFLYLYRQYKDSSPGVPYIVVIGSSICLSQYLAVPTLHVEPHQFELALPFPEFDAISPSMHLRMFLFAGMLMLIDVIEQVMSNAAIEKFDPLGRKANNNNSLLVMWIANGVSSFFGGMTNLDGLAKSSTNRMAGARSKNSVLAVALVIGVVLLQPQVLEYLPKYSLAVLMIFTGWKMIAGLFHVAEHGKYGVGLALFCGVLVYRLGIFEGLLIAVAVHGFITWVVYRHARTPLLEMLKKLLALFGDGTHPHATEAIHVMEDGVLGGVRYRSTHRSDAMQKSLDQFIADWADGLNRHNLLGVVGCYDAQGLLWGTFAKELRVGHGRIRPYFEHLIELDGLRVDFDTAETRQYEQIFIRSGSYRFSYNKKGARVEVLARYSFVCKRERTGWYIVEHHSSEFPN